MQFTKILFFIMLIATGVAPLYGMFIPKTFAQRLDDKNLSEQATLKILQETEDYEQVIIQEKEDFRGLLVSTMLRSGQKIPSHLMSAQAYSVSWLQEINAGLLSQAIKNEHKVLINFLIEKNINLSKYYAENLLIDSMKNNILQRYAVGSQEESNQKVVVEFLIGKEIDVDRVLEVAVLAGYPIVVELSVKNGANIDGVNSNFRPLNAAVFLHVDNVVDRSQTIKILLDAGADTKLLNKNGESVEGMIKEKPEVVQQTDWGQRILSSRPLPTDGGNPDNNPLPNPHVGGNPDNNPTPSIFNVIKQNKGFAFVGAVIGAGVIIWGCKKLYAKYQEYAKQQEEVDGNEQGAQEAVN